MANSLAEEEVFASVHGGNVYLRFTDGCTKTVPSNVIRKSQLLHQALSGTKCGCQVSLRLPPGILRSWLRWRALKGEARMYLDGPDYQRFLQAADYLNDEDSLHTLCRRAARWLLKTDGYEGHTASHKYQMIQELPTDLIITILRSSTLQLSEQVTVLPSGLHVAALHAAFPSISSHASIKVRGLASGTQDASTLWNLLSQVRNLQKLDANGNQLQAHNIRGFERCLQSNTSLQQIHLGGNQIGPRGVKTFASQLTVLRSLQQLHFGGNCIGARGAQALSPYLPYLTSLQKLNLQGNYIGAEGSAALASRLANMSALQQLDMSANSMDADCVAALAPELACLTSLKELNLRSNILGYRGGRVLAQYLSCFQTLRHLSLGHNFMEDDGILALSGHLSELVSLQNLDLEANRIATAGCRALAVHLKDLGSLQHLSLALNIVGSAGFKLLARHLKDLSCLTQVDLHENEIGINDVRKHAASLQHIISV